MSNFIAKRDLSPEDFEVFSGLYKSDLTRQRLRIAHCRREIAVAEEGIKWAMRDINDTKRRMLKHGIEE